jgi:hypothetical protein
MFRRLVPQRHAQTTERDHELDGELNSSTVTRIAALAGVVTHPPPVLSEALLT